MLVDMLHRHWVTIFAVILFSIKLWPKKRFRNTETKYFWLTVLSCLILVLEDSFESICSLDPALRFLRTVLSIIGYTFRSTSALGLLLVIVPRHKKHIIYWIPSIITLLVCSTAFFTDIAFGFDENYAFYRGPLGYVAFAVPVLYIILSLWIIFRNFSERSSLERFIMPICAVFCLSSSLLDVLYGGVRTNEAIIISSIFFYLVLFSNDNRRDSLTGLLNRQAFYDDCNLYNRSIGAIASLDMNGLKLLNDTQGHQAGDKALTTIGSCMLKIADERTLAYRIGGDEFIIIFLHSDEKVITDVEKKITDSVTAAGYNISTGYAVRGDEDAVDDVVRKSDDRMYKAKADYYHSKGEEQRVAHYQCQE